MYECFLWRRRRRRRGRAWQQTAVTDAPLGFHLSATNTLIDRPRIRWTLCHLSVKSSSSHSSDRFPLPTPALLSSHPISAHTPACMKHTNTNPSCLLRLIHTCSLSFLLKEAGLVLTGRNYPQNFLCSFFLKESPPLLQLSAFQL